jgi:hypothetical protein
MVKDHYKLAICIVAYVYNESMRVSIFQRIKLLLLLFKMFIFVKRHFTIFFEAHHSTRTKVWFKIMGEHIYQNNFPSYRNRF